jgi:hypothetical protein
MPEKGRLELEPDRDRDLDRDRPSAIAAESGDLQPDRTAAARAGHGSAESFDGCRDTRRRPRPRDNDSKFMGLLTI